MKTPQNAVPVTSDFLIQAIVHNDPQLVNFLDAIFTLVDGATSDDPVKKLSPKQIQQALWKLPILAMRSPIVLGLYSKFDQQVEGTVVFPTPDIAVLVESQSVVINEVTEPIGEPNDNLIPADYQSGADDDNGDLPSCEMDHNEDDYTPSTVENLYPPNDQWTEQDYADFAKDNPDTIAPKATKSKK